MSFGNVPRDLNLSSISTSLSTSSKSINGFFAADIRTVGSLVQYQQSPGVWVTVDASLTVPKKQLGNVYLLPSAIRTHTQNLDGSVLAVGLAPPVAGSVLSILTNKSGFYNQQAIPFPPDAVNVVYGAVSLSDSGNILAFGSGSDNGGLGAVWIYLNIGGVWTIQGQKITAPGEIGIGNFGEKLSLSGAGNLLAVSSFNETPAGAVYIFNLNSLSNPVLVSRLVPSSLYPNFSFGLNVAFSADGFTLAVAASSILDTNGSVFIFTKNSASWQLQALIQKPSSFSTQYFAYNVSLTANGNTLVVSSTANAVIYYRSPFDFSWSSGTFLPIPYDLVGQLTTYFAEISQDGNTILTSNSANNQNVGASWIFTQSQSPAGTYWSQNGPALIGTTTSIIPALQGYSKISGNGKVASVQDNSNQNLLWIFI